MRKLLALAMLVFASLSLYSQTGPPAPDVGIWALINNTYNVGSTTLGYTNARITLKNTTLTKYVGVQFRVFYDNIAFSNATVALLGTTTNLDMQYVTNAAAGYITVTLVYTGSSQTYTLAEGETFEITFTHAPSSTFNTLGGITPLSWTGAQPFQQYAASQAGLDTNLNLYSYGGIFTRPTFSFHGSFRNVTLTGAKNLTLALEKKPKVGSSWSQVAQYITDENGNFAFTEVLDTTYWDVRLAVKGDTMGIGNIVSTTDAQLINQWVLGNGSMSGFDYYTADVNSSNSVTITDASAVFGKIAGRISNWPNSTKNIKFFTATEFATINGAAQNFTSTIPGTTNFYYNILVGQPDSVVYYIAVPGDANGTGYHMARVTPIEVLINPTPGVESQIYNVIDQTVQYDFPTASIEVNVPHLSVQEGNLVEIPVKVLTNGTRIGSLQFGLKYDDTLLGFKGIYTSSGASKWLTYINANDGQIDWGGYDVSNNENSLGHNDEIVRMQFVALRPQGDWKASPLYTTNKFAGNTSYRDLNITPTNGILQVLKMKGSGKIIEENTIEIYPNPCIDDVVITFSVSEAVTAELGIYDIVGRKLLTVVSGHLPEGQFSYCENLGTLSPGVYIATLTMENGAPIFKRIVKEK